MPDYESLWPQAVKSLPGGGKVFAGQRDDAFFLPLDRVFDSVNLDGAGTGNQGGGIDTLAGYGVQSVVLQVPEAQVTRDGKPVTDAKAAKAATNDAKGANAVIGVWASTERQRLQVTNNSPGETSAQRQQQLGSGLASGQPADQRAVHSAVAEGHLQPHPAVGRWRSLRQVRPQPVPRGGV